MNRNLEILSIVSAVYSFYGKTTSDMIVDFWIAGLAEYDLESIKNAFTTHMKTPPQGRFLPKLADITDILKGDSQDRSLVAWAKFDRTLRTIGSYQSIIFDDPIIHLIISDMGGWCSFDSKTEDEWPFVRNEFINRYKAYSKMNKLPMHHKVMIGKTQMENEKNGYASPEPIAIGAAEQVALVYKTGRSRQNIEPKRLSDVLNSSEGIDFRQIA